MPSFFVDARNKLEDRIIGAINPATPANPTTNPPAAPTPHASNSMTKYTDSPYFMPAIIALVLVGIFAFVKKG